MTLRNITIGSPGISSRSGMLASAALIALHGQGQAVAHFDPAPRLALGPDGYDIGIAKSKLATEPLGLPRSTRLDTGHAMICIGAKLDTTEGYGIDTGVKRDLGEGYGIDTDKTDSIGFTDPPQHGAFNGTDSIFAMASKGTAPPVVRTLDTSIRSPEGGDGIGFDDVSSQHHDVPRRDRAGHVLLLN